jgi:hypothetical protein
MLSYGLRLGGYRVYIQCSIFFSHAVRPQMVGRRINDNQLIGKDLEEVVV